MPYVTGAAILTHVGEDSPSADQTAWAGTVADALEAEIALRLVGVTVTAGMSDILERAALQDGAAGYLERESPHGIVTLGDGETARLGRDLLRALVPVLDRLATPGIA